MPSRKRYLYSSVKMPRRSQFRMRQRARLWEQAASLTKMRNSSQQYTIGSVCGAEQFLTELPSSHSSPLEHTRLGSHSQLNNSSESTSEDDISPYQQGSSSGYEDVRSESDANIQPVNSFLCESSLASNSDVEWDLREEPVGDSFHARNESIDEYEDGQNIPGASHKEDSYLHQPLCDFTTTTKGEALLMCLVIGLRHSLPWTAIVDILKMINCLFGQEVVRATKYFFRKYTDVGNDKLTYHLYCDYCHRYLGSRDNLTEGQVECLCGKTLKDLSRAKSFFLSLSLGEQLKELLCDKFFVESLQTRFKRQKVQENSFEDVYDGELYSRLSAPGQVLSHWENMSYTFNTDGFPVGGKSGRQTCWPIYVQINELPHSLRSKFMLLAGLYVGTKDPNMQIFMHPFVEEANNLSTVGIDWYLNSKEMNSKIIPLSACVDTPARSKILNMTAFSGRFGCSICLNDPESTKSGRRYTVPINAFIERTHEDILKDAAKAHENRTSVRNKMKRRVCGVKGPTPLHNLLYFDLVKGVRPDIMHSILLGNGKHHISVLHGNPGKAYYIGSEVRMLAIKQRLLSIKPPSSFPRAPRDFCQFVLWKANEYLSWMLFYAVPCLYDIIPDEFVDHFSLLSTALHILLRKSVSPSDLHTAHILALRYVFLFQQYFGKEEMVFNIHLLMHIKKSVEYLGPAWTQMAFSFEGSNKFLLELKKGTSSIAKEIANKYLAFKALPLLCEKYASSEDCIEFCQTLSGRPLLKSICRVKDVVLTGQGKRVVLDSEENECLSNTVFSSASSICFQKFVMQGIRYCVASYGINNKRDDSYISVQNKTKAQIQRVLRFVEQDKLSVVVLVREILVEEVPLFKDEFQIYSHIQRIKGKGQLLAIQPEDISGQCIAMFLESGDFICDVPYGCYGDS